MLTDDETLYTIVLRANIQYFRGWLFINDTISFTFDTKRRCHIHNDISNQKPSEIDSIRPSIAESVFANEFEEP